MSLDINHVRDQHITIRNHGITTFQPDWNKFVEISVGYSVSDEFAQWHKRFKPILHMTNVTGKVFRSSYSLHS